MTPWRKRLGDFRALIENAEKTYFEPDLFRLNVNGAIQTARTVTFLIQKNKGSVQDFDGWYKTNVLSRLRGDRIMEWLKESRNRIEKEGDLELNSECNLETIFSYTDPGPRMSLKSSAQLFIGIKRLIRTVQKVFPTGVYRDSAIAIDRRWVANSLPNIEIVDALHYGYSQLEQIVDSLERHIGGGDSSIPPPMRVWHEAGPRRIYLKTDDGRFYSFAGGVSTSSAIDWESAKDRYDLNAFVEAFRSTSDLKVALVKFADLACSLYAKDGYHITIGFLLDEDGVPVSMVRPQFSTHVDKLIFWHELAHAAEADRRIRGVIFISEIWMRSSYGFPQKRISELEIMGEGLQIVAANKDTCLTRTIPLVKGESGSRLDVAAADPGEDLFPNFLVPLRNVWMRN